MGLFATAEQTVLKNSERMTKEQRAANLWLHHSQYQEVVSHILWTLKEIANVLIPGEENKNSR